MYMKKLIILAISAFFISSSFAVTHKDGDMTYRQLSAHNPPDSIRAKVKGLKNEIKNTSNPEAKKDLQNELKSLKQVQELDRSLKVKR